MSKFVPLLASIKNEAYPAKKQLLEYTLKIIQKIQEKGDELSQDDRRVILEYAYGEVDAFLLDIPQAANYREKDTIFACEDLLLGMIIFVCPSPAEIPGEVMAKIQLLVETVAKERYIETAIDRIFKQDQIDGSQMADLLLLVSQTDDEYQKSKLYTGLVHYHERICSMTQDAKAHMSAHLTAELKRYLRQEIHHEDCIANLELMADVSKYFADDEVLPLLHEVMALGYGNINYYAVGTLLSAGQSVPADVILSLAKDLEYANLTYQLLMGAGKTELFPEEYATPEYLAKSDLVHWLMYPTELGKAPDQIEYIGKITYQPKKDVYFVFKYRSDSDTLEEGLRNKWLIGWSSDNGGTFSNFDEYALFEKGTVEATLKNIKKQLIG